MKISEQLYRWFNREGNEELYSQGLSDTAAANLPSNYLKLLGTNLLTQLSDALSNPKTVLTWLMNSIGVPISLTSLVVPLRESGSMLPQILIALKVKRYQYRKSLWLAGAVIQSVSLIGIGMVSVWFEGAAAGWLILLLLTIFSLARALVSVTSKDIVGKTVPKSKRGKLTGYASAFSSILVLGAGVWIGSIDNSSIYAVLMILSGTLWYLALYVYHTVHEPEGEVSVQQKTSPWNLLKTDSVLQRFITARALLLCSALTTPFYITLAQQYHQGNPRLLAYFVIATGIAGLVSSSVWGRRADESSKMVMVYGAVISSLVGVVVILTITLSPTLQSFTWWYPLLVFILTVGYTAVRIGRKTYIVDVVEGNKRTDYVSISNTVIALVLLVLGVASSLLSLISIPVVILVLSLFGLLGAYLSYRLPEVNEKP